MPYRISAPKSEELHIDGMLKLPRNMEIDKNNQSNKGPVLTMIQETSDRARDVRVQLAATFK